MKQNRRSSNEPHFMRAERSERQRRADRQFRERDSKTDKRKRLRAAQITVALARIYGMNTRDLMQRRNAHVAKLKEQFYPRVAIDHIRHMSPREYRDLLISRLFHPHQK